MNKKGVSNDNVINKIICDPNIHIKNDGKIFSNYALNGRLSDKKRLVGSKRSDGYLRFRYKGKFVLVHRVIYRKFLGPLRKDWVINHKDGNTSNNNTRNLELVTQSKNSLHAYRILGRIIPPQVGQKNGNAVFSDRKIVTLRKKYSEGKITLLSIIESYNKNFRTTIDALEGKTYSHIKSYDLPSDHKKQVSLVQKRFRTGS